MRLSLTCEPRGHTAGATDQTRGLHATRQLIRLTHEAGNHTTMAGESAAGSATIFVTEPPDQHQIGHGPPGLAGSLTQIACPWAVMSYCWDSPPAKTRKVVLRPSRHATRLVVTVAVPPRSAVCWM